MAYRDMTKTVFGDVQALPIDIYRITTESSTYTISIHEERGRKYALVRGASGTDREHVVVRDSDPRIGERSLFDVHYTEWIGQPLDVATMRTSPIVTATRLVVGAPAPEQGIGHLPAPPGMSDNPRIVPMQSRGTAIGDAPQRELARQVVVASAPLPATPAPLPYPLRHVRYAEDIATLLRSIHRRDRLFEDVAHDRELRERLANALDAAEKLLAEIRKRGK
jgi:hypothetical protein